MKQFQGLRTTKAMLAAGLLAAALVTGCSGGEGAQQSGDSGAVQQETSGASSTTDAANDAVGADESPMLLADYNCEVSTETGERVMLTEIAGGRPLVINYWATWCPYCVEELPEFAEVADEYGDRVSFAFLDVADGAKETVDGTKAWLADQGLDSLPVYYDTIDNNLDATASFKVFSLPTTIVVNSNGEVADRIVGSVDMGALRQKLDALA